MNWQEVFAILVPVLGFMGWGYSRIEKRFEAVEKRFDAIEKKIDSIYVEISFIKDRLSRLEGRFDERGYWEARKATGTDGP